MEVHDTTPKHSGTLAEETVVAPTERNKGESDSPSTDTIVDTPIKHDFVIGKLTAETTPDCVGNKGMGKRIL